MTGRRYSLNAQGEHDLAREAGFDTYDDFVQWKLTAPDDYERWYRNLLTHGIDYANARRVVDPK